MPHFTPQTKIWEVLQSPKARQVITKHAPYLLHNMNLRELANSPLASLAGNARPFVTTDQYQAIIEDLARPIAHVFPEYRDNKSLDVLDLESYQAGPPPLATPPVDVTLTPGEVSHTGPRTSLSLDGEWQLAEGGDQSERISGRWDDAIRAEVPGSVHSALVAAGRLPDPTFGTNQKTAKEESFKTWWLKTEFDGPSGMASPTLRFDGVCNRATFWLNGEKLGTHEGMFGGPAFDVAGRLKDRNTLVVKLEPIPFEPRHAHQQENPENNGSWQRTVVFNNVYGWHYSNLPSLGIWRSVHVDGEPIVSIEHPFIAAVDAAEGLMGLVVDFSGPESGFAGTLSVTVAPENFGGDDLSFEAEVRANGPSARKHFRFRIPDPKLWWPVDLGEQNLYRLSVSFAPIGAGSTVSDHQEAVFGIRTIEQAPLPEGPRPDLYNWIFVINGEQHFIKGTNWCTLDPLMDFSRSRYERFVSLAADQHIQMFRPWGSGMPETDDFYDLCDRYGILVMQEWPTAWNSHEMQPYDVLEETVILNTLRMRNHPSLAMYGAGNESSNPFGIAIDMMGRHAVELDGTRVFHRGEPWGGSLHNYHCYWGRQRLDHNVNMIAPFFGEFGLACTPPYESVARYLPEDEKTQWPPREDGAFAYHTPIFNTRQGVSRLTQYASYFMPEDCNLEEGTVGSQLSQGVGLRHPLERARTRWPDCAGALYYKLTDNFPAASWATVDWYGAPKIGYYMVKDAFAPLHACLLFRTLYFEAEPMDFPVYLLDDGDELAGSRFTVLVRAFAGNLEEIKRQEYSGEGSIDAPHRLGDFALDQAQTADTPLLLAAEVHKNGSVADRTFYIANFEARKGCLFALPRTSLTLEAKGRVAKVRNTGRVPAVAVSVERPGHLDTFTVSDAFFWLDPGEEKTLDVSEDDGLTISAWNMEGRAYSWE